MTNYNLPGILSRAATGDSTPYDIRQMARDARTLDRIRVRLEAIAEQKDDNNLSATDRVLITFAEDLLLSIETGNQAGSA